MANFEPPPTSTRYINVLVIFGERRRPLRLTLDGSRGSDLKTAFFEAFEDIVDQGSKEKFFFQLESDKWGGRFVDLGEEDTLVDNSVVKAVPLQARETWHCQYYFCGASYNIISQCMYSRCSIP